MFSLENAKIAIIGLGYVGLPLAVEFSKKYPVIGFDINQSRIRELQSGTDSTLEVSDKELSEAKALFFSSDKSALSDANVFIVTVPTPIDKNKQPDLTPLIKASELLGSVVKKNDVVIYESTVYPGATEESCLPVVERVSGLTFNQDFYAGYSPERINPGDKERHVTNIIKVTSGSNNHVANYVDALYASIITAGTYKATSIKVAEAAKVIENTQRDVNIALINELSMIFNKLGIDTLEVLEAAGTKWNFLPFRPGLVGGHCIGVDPYYLANKAKEMGYHPEIISACRRVNDSMGVYVVSQFVKRLLQERIHVNGAKILVLGFTFKENCPDIRNTGVIDIINELNDYNVDVDIHDPWCSAAEVIKEYNIELTDTPEQNSYDGIILAVGHHQFKLLGRDGIKLFGKKKHILYDLKYILEKKDSDMRL
ncbi:Vi polysaccharide biosynthesis UDP-N-acetylglucosamine C-6 dehydrogenase TviB [Luminiphilus sp.]|nr:Vi polysaccharide biosynthesis UDP-N-acetylglucosamine C-6 dehydrogenase TviB [Luminiphilus sp.]